jgi:hypothetical protein
MMCSERRRWAGQGDEGGPGSLRGSEAGWAEWAGGQIRAVQRAGLGRETAWEACLAEALGRMLSRLFWQAGQDRGMEAGWTGSLGGLPGWTQRDGGGPGGGRGVSRAWDQRRAVTRGGGGRGRVGDRGGGAQGWRTEVCREMGGCRPGWGSEVGQGEGWRRTGPAEAGREEAMGRRRTGLPGYGYGTVTMVHWAGGWGRAVQRDEGGMGWLRAGIGHCRETEAA